ncbi:hypothetical protein M407DRAFT_245578 [Tulasnella calospora MUT 4182]|uniref:Uncharacterized protein n=1 Tax=Tulasnella calospora MUT 4182 TaxID=1051891 RepID=A0A0C3QAF4_9AGAM|nr:hypothetical protein M407DRAFT_245578 [Tulasnella calospora MUT 4182]
MGFVDVWGNKNGFLREDSERLVWIVTGLVLGSTLSPARGIFTPERLLNAFIQ